MLKKSLLAIGLALLLVVPSVLATEYTSGKRFDFWMEMAKLGLSVNKFGRSTNVDTGVSTDIWDRANAVDDQDIWTAPTTARIHQIVSTSVSDDGSPVGVGARTLRIFGLIDWDADGETTEDITLNGTTNVPTVNSYVIIYRLTVLTKGATSSNVGIITATADTDATVTAQIQPDIGQSQMAIFAISSRFNYYLISFYSSVQAVSSGKEIKITLLENPEPDVELTNFLNQHSFGIGGGGTTDVQHMFMPFKKMAGPSILKVNAIGDADDMDVSAGFDIILERK